MREVLMEHAESMAAADIREKTVKNFLALFLLIFTERVLFYVYGHLKELC